MTQAQREPITPVAVERELADLSDRLEELRLQLVDARNAENDAKRAYEIMKVRAAAHSACPRVKRGEVTVAERQAWIDEHCLDAQLALQDAKNLRVIASEALRNAQKQVETVQSIGASVRTSYQYTGRRP
jgi:hypothetical protein